MAEKSCPNVKRNAEACPCGSEDCARRGTCCECIRAHVASGSLPACCREVATVAAK